jgi:hypothetical protein
MESRIQVFVRVRPVQGSLVEVVQEENAVKVPGNAIDESMVFKFDRVFNIDSTQSQVYDSVNHLLSEVRNGKNATIFAYGQTGAGKTHSILGSKMDPGILPRMVEQLVREVVDEDKGCVQASWMECYQEKLFDLRDRKSSLDIRGDRTFTSIKGLFLLYLFTLHFKPYSFGFY